MKGLIDNLRHNHGPALERLIRDGFFGNYYRVANGDLMWHLIHQSNWPERIGGVNVEDVLNKMKEKVDAGIFDEDNLQFILTLAERGAFGDITRVLHPDQKFFPEPLKRYSNWLYRGIVGTARRYDTLY